MEFQIGDKVVGKPEASLHYSVTREGTEWIVISILPQIGSRRKRIEIAYEDVYLKFGPYCPGFEVNAQYFEHVKVFNKDFKHRLEGSELY